MNPSTSFRRKVIYLVLAGGLLIPLSLVSRPASRDRDNRISDRGGVLSQLRESNELSPARLSEIDPASETMKLASLGLRGLAVNLLWLQAIKAKDEKEFDVFASTLESLVKIQPTFIRVWEYQAHNLAYNVAVEFDDYEQRYHWIKKGIHFLTEGIPYNRRDHRIFDNLGMFTGHKFGRADERFQYRALFRNDDAFHEEMSRFVPIDQINTPFGPDNWLLAYLFYDRSVKMVDVEKLPQHRKDMIFFQYKPAQLRNMGMSMQAEFRAGEYARNLWDRAHGEWLEYGNRPLYFEGDRNRPPVTLESLTQSIEKVRNLREDLDALAPSGIRNQLLADKLARLSPEDREMLTRPIDSLDDAELAHYREFTRFLYRDSPVDVQVAEAASSGNRRLADDIVKRIREEDFKIQLSESFRDTMNYDHWRDYAEIESTERGIAARQMQFDAETLTRRSILTEYTERNPVTGEVSRKPGAIQQLDGAYSIWAEVMNDYPQLRTGPLMNEIVDTMSGPGGYMVLRRAAGLDEWPDDFVLQEVIDHRARGQMSFDDHLPTSELLERDRQERGRRGSMVLPDRPDIRFRLEQPTP